MRLLYTECCFFFQAEDGIRDLVRSRGLGDVYKRQRFVRVEREKLERVSAEMDGVRKELTALRGAVAKSCLLYTSDAADERSSVDLGGRRIIKKKKDDGDGRCLSVYRIGRRQRYERTEQEKEGWRKGKDR